MWLVYEMNTKWLVVDVNVVHGVNLKYHLFYSQIGQKYTFFIVKSARKVDYFLKKVDYFFGPKSARFGLK